jgi:hypothetical protein
VASTTSYANGGEIGEDEVFVRFDTPLAATNMNCFGACGLSR